MTVPTARVKVSERLDGQRLPRDTGWQNLPKTMCWNTGHSRPLRVEAMEADHLEMPTGLHTGQDLASTWIAPRVVPVKDRAIPLWCLSDVGRAI